MVKGKETKKDGGRILNIFISFLNNNKIKILDILKIKPKLYIYFSILRIYIYKSIYIYIFLNIFIFFFS